MATLEDYEALTRRASQRFLEAEERWVEAHRRVRAQIDATRIAFIVFPQGLYDFLTGRADARFEREQATLYADYDNEVAALEAESLPLPNAVAL